MYPNLVEIAKIFEMGTSGGRGVFSDFGHPRTRGGQKRANFCGRPLWTAPKFCSHQFMFKMEAPFRSYGMTFKHLVRGGGGGVKH